MVVAAVTEVIGSDHTDDGGDDDGDGKDNSDEGNWDDKI